MNVFDILKRLCNARGVAGSEHYPNFPSSVARVALELIQEFDQDATIDCQGSVVGMIGNKNSNQPTIMLDAHIDQVGLIVTHIDSDGFIKAEPCGGIDRRALAGAAVTIHAVKPVKGVICTLPPHVQGSGKSDVIKPDKIRIDVGFTKEKSQELITPGDVVTVDGELTPMQGRVVSGPALDNRAGVCAILYALHLLKEKSLQQRIAVSFSVQEELGCRGAAVTAYNIEPEYAIVVDVSYGLLPGSTDSKTEHKFGKLGAGAMIGYAPCLNRGMFEGLKKVADEKEIPRQIEIMNDDTGGTNADVISVVKGGVKTALVSIPLRYMHTSVETADLSDIEAAGKLIAAFIESSDLGGGKSE